MNKFENNYPELQHGEQGNEKIYISLGDIETADFQVWG